MKEPFSTRAADLVSRFFGTWTFVIINVSFFIGWIIANSLRVEKLTFDPWPYILLNLILSMMAAFENPIILMSANRLERIDRQIAEHNYELSLAGDEMLRQILSELEKERKVQIDLVKMLGELHDTYDYSNTSDSTTERITS